MKTNINSQLKNNFKPPGKPGGFLMSGKAIVKIIASADILYCSDAPE
jgi:hypothetical protein